jgi:elongator complex protein 3
MMPGLPGADPETDLKDAKNLFADDSFRPDMMKVYPTLVVEGTTLARLYETGVFSPYDLDTVVDLLSEMKRYVPRWHRIMRIQREIPAHEISAGVKNGNLRELVLLRARQKGHPCECIRCREVALGEPGVLGGDDELRYTESQYTASGGTEVFGSFEYEKSGKIAGFFRLRCPSSLAHRAETRGSSILRELRVYGTAVPVGDFKTKAWQHKGLGGWLMEEAEKTALEDFDSKRVLVTSAVGTRNYYRRLGYERLGPYMCKKLQR